MESPRMHIAVASGKGGTGKTTIATNLVAVMRRDGLDVTYADCDVEEPNGHLFLTLQRERQHDVAVPVPVVDESRCTLCGVCAEICEFNALAVMGEKVLLFPTLCHGCGACIWLCPEHAIHEADRRIGFIRQGTDAGLAFVGGSLEVGESQAPPLTRAVKRALPTRGVVVIDAPPGTSCPVVEAVRHADYVVLVTEPTPFGLNDLRLAVELIRELDRPFGVVVNRCDVGDDCVRAYCRTERIRLLLELPFDRRIAEAYAAGRLGVEVDHAFGAHMKQLHHAVQLEVELARACRRQR